MMLVVAALVQSSAGYVHAAVGRQQPIALRSTARTSPLVLVETPIPSTFMQKKPESSNTEEEVVGVVASTAAVNSGDKPLMPPRDREAMLQQATAAVNRARADSKTRFILRLFLPRGDDMALTPPDESWQGGIMQLYAACSPLVRELLRRLSAEVAGLPPSLTETRLDPSGVDGESVWMAQSSSPQDDAVGLVQPSAERMGTIRKLSSDAGNRPLLLVNPQWKERDDPFDALSRKGGLLGALGSALGGKAVMDAELGDLGFVETYTLAEYVCRGSRICLHLEYPFGWTASYRNAETDGWVALFSGAPARPTYQEIEDALKDADVPFRYTEFDLNNIV